MTYMKFWSKAEHDRAAGESSEGGLRLFQSCKNKAAAHTITSVVCVWLKKKCCNFSPRKILGTISSQFSSSLQAQQHMCGWTLTHTHTHKCIDTDELYRPLLMGSAIEIITSNCTCLKINDVMMAFFPLLLYGSWAFRTTQMTLEQANSLKATGLHFSRRTPSHQHSSGRQSFIYHW